MGGGVGEAAALANFIAAMTTAAEGAAVAAPAAASAALPAAAGAIGAGTAAAKALPTASSISSILPGGELMGGWLSGNTGIGAESLAGGTKLGGILGGQSIGAVPLTANPDYFKLMLLANALRQEESEPQMGAAPSGGVSSRKGEAKMPEEPNPIEQLLKQRTLSQLLGGGLYG